MAKAAFKPWEQVSDTTIRVGGGATKNPKKLTGTRLGAVAGVNKWKTPFGAWCEIVRVAEEPFEDNKFTLAGKAIEPALLEWCKVEVSPYIVTPEQHFGTKDTGYDYFPNEPILGGMWDALALDGAKGSPIAVIEAKTTSRPQDWENGVPDAYALQGLLYAYLLGVDRVFFPVAFLTDEDYDHPENFVCTDDNTFMYELKVSASDIEATASTALAWWEKHVVANISPKFDEKRDKTFLSILRKSEVKSVGLEALAKEAAILEAKIEAIVAKSDLDSLQKSLDSLKKQMKPEFIKLFKDTDDTVTAYGWRVKRSDRSSLDKEAMAADNVLDKYTVMTATYTLTKENTNG
jgi:predicted phage-related endonuclease